MAEGVNKTMDKDHEQQNQDHEQKQEQERKFDVVKHYANGVLELMSDLQLTTEENTGQHEHLCGKVELDVRYKICLICKKIKCGNYEGCGKYVDENDLHYCKVCEPYERRYFCSHEHFIESMTHKHECVHNDKEYYDDSLDIVSCFACMKRTNNEDAHYCEICGVKERKYYCSHECFIKYINRHGHVCIHNV
jgi:hypothetical protein